MENKKNKMRAPIIASIILIAYYIVYFTFILSFTEGVWKYIFGVLPVVFSILIIAVCIERIKEIKGGEEDDLSKY